MSAVGENTLQGLIKGQLLRNAYFTAPRAIAIVTIDDGDILNLIDQAISAFNGGVAISIECPVGDNISPKSGAVNLLGQVEIAVTEYGVINRAATGIGKSAYAICRQLMRTYQPDGSGGLQFYSPGPPFLRMELHGYESGQGKLGQKLVVVYRARFECKEILP